MMRRRVAALVSAVAVFGGVAAGMGIAASTPDVGHQRHDGQPAISGVADRALADRAVVPPTDIADAASPPIQGQQINDWPTVPKLGDECAVRSDEYQKTCWSVPRDHHPVVFAVQNTSDDRALVKIRIHNAIDNLETNFNLKGGDGQALVLRGGDRLDILRAYFVAKTALTVTATKTGDAVLPQAGLQCSADPGQVTACWKETRRATAYTLTMHATADHTVMSATNEITGETSPRVPVDKGEQVAWPLRYGDVVWLDSGGMSIDAITNAARASRTVSAAAAPLPTVGDLCQSQLLARACWYNKTGTHGRPVVFSVKAMGARDQVVNYEIWNREDGYVQQRTLTVGGNDQALVLRPFEQLSIHGRQSGAALRVQAVQDQAGVGAKTDPSKLLPPAAGNQCTAGDSTVDCWRVAPQGTPLAFAVQAFAPLGSGQLRYRITNSTDKLSTTCSIGNQQQKALSMRPGDTFTILNPGRNTVGLKVLSVQTSAATSAAQGSQCGIPAR